MSEFWPDDEQAAPSILCDVRDKVAIVTLNRPESLNAWTPKMGTLYFNTLDRLAADPEVRVILVHGAGRSFCAGADMKGLSNIADSGGETPDRDHRPYWFPMTIGKPVIAAIHGHCYTVGLQQTLCADIRFAAPSAKFCLPYSKRGLPAEVGTAWMLSRLIGPARSMDFFLSSKAMSAEKALAAGLVNEIFAEEELFEKSFEYCREIAAEASPWSLRTIKQQIHHSMMTSLVPAFEDSEKFLTEALSGADFVEGIKAFKEKRAPEFPPLAPSLATIAPWPGE